MLGIHQLDDRVRSARLALTIFLEVHLLLWLFAIAVLVREDFSLAWSLAVTCILGLSLVGIMVVEFDRSRRSKEHMRRLSRRLETLIRSASPQHELAEKDYGLRLELELRLGDAEVALKHASRTLRRGIAF